jgi:hypothetical protein
VITRDRPGHVHDQHIGAAIDDGQQLLAYLAGIGHIDVLGESHGCLPARPRHGIGVLKHGRPGRRDQSWRWWWRWWWRYPAHVDQFEAEAGDPLHQPGKGFLI